MYIYIYKYIYIYIYIYSYKMACRLDYNLGEAHYFRCGKSQLALCPKCIN